MQNFHNMQNRYSVTELHRNIDKVPKYVLDISRAQISSLNLGHLESAHSFVKEIVKQESIFVSVAEKCAWMKANSCRWRTDVSFTR